MVNEPNKGQQFTKPWSPEYGSSVPTLYHGSPTELPVGAVITHRMDFNPNRMAGVDSETENMYEDMGFAIGNRHPGEHVAFASDSQDYAAEFAHNRSNAGGFGHIYQVKPVDPNSLHHLMPNEIGSYHGFRIVKKGHVSPEGGVHWSHGVSECDGSRFSEDNNGR
jgi:hypothetical protein